MVFESIESLIEEQQPEEEMGLIRGREPGSREEWRAAKALVRLDVDFLYQVSLRGGKDVRGGQVLDFLLFIPFAQPAQVFNKYWHKGELDGEERIKLSYLKQIYGYEAIIWWGFQLQTDDDALQAVRESLNR